jgi:hypothetical protein
MNIYNLTRWICYGLCLAALFATAFAQDIETDIMLWLFALTMFGWHTWCTLLEDERAASKRIYANILYDADDGYTIYCPYIMDVVVSASSKRDAKCLYERQLKDYLLRHQDNFNLYQLYNDGHYKVKYDKIRYDKR